MFGFTGKILHVNLTTGGIEVEQPPEEFYRTYWGGSLMGTYYLLKNTPPGADPLGPENTLSFMLSPTTGVPISGQSRCTATAKSPTSGLIGDSQAGGFWPAELKFAGFDGIVLTGRSPKPVYLWVHDGEAELRDAGASLGQDHRRGGGCHQGGAGRPQDRGDAGRPGGRAPLPAGVHHQHVQPCPRPHRHGRGDGQQEPEGDRRARPRQGQRRGSEGGDQAGAPGRGHARRTSRT